MKCEAIYCFDTAGVRFAVHPQGPGGPRAIAEISEDALRDLFGATGGGESLIAACDRNFTAIEAKAIERILADPPGELRLETTDFARSTSPVREADAAAAH